MALLAAAALLLVGVTPAFGWRAAVLAPGATTLDLGALEQAPAVFATLPKDAAPIELTLRLAAGERTRLRLFAPDRLPERRMRGDELPSIVLPGRAGASFQRDERSRRLRDPATGIRLRSIGVLDIPAAATGDGGPVVLRIVPGVLPARALLVAGEAGERANFELDDPASVPGIVARMRMWADTPPTGTPRRLLREPDASHRGSTPAVLLGAAITVAMVLLAAWWMLRGRAESRRNGQQRRSPD